MLGIVRNRHREISFGLKLGKNKNTAEHVGVLNIS